MASPVFEVLKIIVVEPVGVGFAGIEFHFHYPSFVIGIVSRYCGSFETCSGDRADEAPGFCPAFPC